MFAGLLKKNPNVYTLKTDAVNVLLKNPNVYTHEDKRCNTFFTQCKKN
jgi:hypothetical protein